MKKKAFWVLGIFMGLMLLMTIVSRGIYAYTLPRVSTTSIQTMALDHSIRGDGSVEKKSEEPICVLPGIRIDEICVKEGENVEEGSVLLRLNEETLNDYIQSLQTDISTLQLQISDYQANAALADSKKQTEIDRASQDYESTAASLDRKISQAGADLAAATEELDDLGSKEDYHSSVSGNDSGDEWESMQKPLYNAVVAAQRAYDDAVEAKNKAMVEAGRSIEDAQAPSTQNSTSKSLSLSLSEKKKELEKYQTLLKNGMDITSTVKGMVSSIQVKPGDITPQTASLLVAEITDQLTFTTTITREEQKLVSMGDSATLSFHNGKDKTEDATVTSIKQSEDNPDSYQLEISFDSTLATIGEGGSYTIKNFSADRSICLPLTAIYSDGRVYYVFVINKKNSILGEELSVTKRIVNIADKNANYAAIENAGLTDEDAIIISTTKPLADGKTVRLLEE